MPIPLKNKVKNYDNTLAGLLINHVENPDSIGFINNVWYSPKYDKRYKPGAFDPKNFGIGIDRKENEYVKNGELKFHKDKQGKEYLTIEEERNTRNHAIANAEDSYKERLKYAQKVLKSQNTPSEVKKAITLSAIYNLGQGYVANNLFEDKPLMNAFLKGTDLDYSNHVNRYFEKENKGDRGKKTNEFIKNWQKQNNVKQVPTTSNAEMPTYRYNDGMPALKSEGGQIEKRKLWDDLSIAEKSEMMKVAIQNGITSLKDIRSKYNEFAEGGPIENYTPSPNETDKIKWFEHWYNNREKQLADNYRKADVYFSAGDLIRKLLPNSVTDSYFAQKAKNHLLQNINSVDEGVLPITRGQGNLTENQYKIAQKDLKDSVSDLTSDDYDKVYYLNALKYGTYYPDYKTILYASDAKAPTIIHERTHASNPRFIENYIGNSKTKRREGIEKDYYLDSANEVYGRLNQFRYKNNLDPTETITPEKLEYLKKNAKDYNLLNRYDDDTLLFLFNDVAYNPTEQHDIPNITAFGGPLVQLANRYAEGGPEEKNKSLADNIRERLYYNVTPRGYENAVPRLFDAVLDKRERRPDSPNLEALWAKYLGLNDEDFRSMYKDFPDDRLIQYPLYPHISDYVQESKYTPSEGKDKDAKYYSLAFPEISNWEVDQFLTSPDKRRQTQGYNDTMGTFTLTKGRDDMGDYISYYDKWDVSPFRGYGAKHDESLGIGKPVELYDRLYLDDYYNNPQSPADYWSKGDYYGGYLPEVIVTASGEPADEGLRGRVPTPDNIGLGTFGRQNPVN